MRGSSRTVSVLIMLPPPVAMPGSPAGWLEAAREVIAQRHRTAFEGLGVADVRIVREPYDGRSFGRRLRELAAAIGAGAPHRSPGLVVLGGGAMPLARPEDLQSFVTAAGGRAPRALANSAYSADAIAVSDARLLLGLPDLPSDNALPRWLAERAGVPVADLRDRPRLAFDIDSPVDVLLVARDPACPAALAALAREIDTAAPQVGRAMEAVAKTLDSPHSELVVAGRTSARTLLWLERNARCRIRALVEEREIGRAHV